MRPNLKHVPLCADHQRMCTLTGLVWVRGDCHQLRHLKGKSQKVFHGANTIRSISSHCSAFEFRHQRTSLWVVLRDVRLGKVVNYLLLYNFGVIDEEFGTFIQQIFRNVDTRRLPVATQRNTLLSAHIGATVHHSAWTGGAKGIQYQQE